MKYIRFFEELGLSDVAMVGGKNASLGEMYCQLTEKGILIPNGFATTADAYWHYIEYNNLTDEMISTLDGLDTGDMKKLAACGQQLRSMIAHATMPDDLESEIIEAYIRLAKQYDEQTLAVSVRSSATA